MYVPAPRERVIVQGRSHYYFVVAIDSEQQVAFVVDLRDHGYVEQIAFSKLSQYPCPVSILSGSRKTAPAQPTAAESTTVKQAPVRRLNGTTGR